MSERIYNFQDILYLNYYNEELKFVDRGLVL